MKQKYALLLVALGVAGILKALFWPKNINQLSNRWKK